MRRTLVLLLLASCPGEEPLPPDETPIPLDALCGELAKADCDRLSACGTLDAPIDPAICQLRQAQVACVPIAAAIEASIDSGSLTYFELAARDCRRAVADLPCTVGLHHDFLELEACRGMIEGNGMDGDPCHLALACAPGFYCAEEDSCPGKCRPFRQNNETCGIGQRCSPDTFCSVTGMRCRARVDLNGTCELSLDNNSCRDGGWCDTSNPAAMRCVPVRGRGQGCNSSFECIAGARCINNLCSAGLENDSCVDVSDCADGRVCRAGRCVSPLARGTPCNEDSIACAEGLVCTSSVGVMACHPQPVIGQRCGDEPCYLSHCEAGTCAPSVRAKERCTTSDECFPGHACRESICEVEPIACSE